PNAHEFAFIAELEKRAEEFQNNF
ncbi:type II toxin-antitoxin system YafO family toxin, partial [Proteus mirabilis]